MRTEDGCIIQECLNGKPEAFGILVDKYKAGIYAFVYAEVGSFQDSQDITQEVFLESYRGLHSLRRWESFAFWLYRIASNHCKDWIKAQSRRPDREFIEDQDSRRLEALSLDSYHDNQVSESLWEAMDSLPKNYRDVLVLHYFGGMSSREIARVTGASHAAIRMRLNRARAQLKSEMIAMMSTAFEEQRLQVSFTFHIVEALKRIKIHPVSQARNLPWGLSLATGLIATLMSLNPYVNPPTHSPTHSPTYSSSPLPGEAKSLKVGEIPVNMLETAEITALPSNQGNGDEDEKAMAPKQQDVNASAPGVELIPDDVKAGDWFGRGICINGNYIIAGAPYRDGKKGAAYVFKYDGTAWREQATLTAKDGAEGDCFGWSAVITDDYAIVGALDDDDMGTNTGSVYIFRFNGSSWTEEAKLKPHGAPIGDCEFGFSISISGNHLIVGAPYDNWAGGAIYIFERVGDAWEEQAKLISSDWARFDNFGWSVSISGDYAIAGAWQHANKKGSAYIFKRDGDSWKEQAALVASDGEAGDWFGDSVSISGDYAIVGADRDKDKGQGAGSAYIFHNDGTSWKQQAKLISSDLAAWDLFGLGVCISGNYALVGASSKDGETGAVYAFLRRGASWEERAKIFPDRAPNHFGLNMSISGNYAVVGAFAHNGNSGAAYIYDCITDLSLPVESKSHTPSTLGGVKSGKSNINMPDVEAKLSVPAEFRLLQNFPNPFNPETWIPFNLSDPEYVTIKIHNSTGGLVRRLDLGHKPSGAYLSKDEAAYWDGRDENGETVASGVYFYTMEAGEHTGLRKMVVGR